MGAAAAAPGPGSRAERAHRAAGRVPPETFFVLGALSQYVGAALAVLLFASVPAAGIAWLRVVAAAGLLAAWRRPLRRPGVRANLKLLLAFGTALAGMNLTFYLAIDRLPLGTTVAIEFLGPVLVAALGSRRPRDVAALVVAVSGVVLLADVQLEGEPLGVALALAAGVLWALYIVLGDRVAKAGLGVDGLAAAMVLGALAIAPLAVWKAVPALTDPLLLAACLGVGLLSSVVPYGLDQVALQRIPRARFALLLALLPATAAVVGAVVLGQVPTTVEAVGIGLVVGAVALRTRDTA